MKKIFVASYLTPLVALSSTALACAGSIPGVGNIGTTISTFVTAGGYIAALILLGVGRVERLAKGVCRERGASMKKIFVASYLTPLVALSSTALACAGSIPGVGNIGTTISTFVTAGGYIAALILLGVAGWDYLTHRQVPRALAEVGGGLLCAVIGANATSILSLFNMSAALIR